ncbi:MAG: AAA family ATPase, partial [Clostridia bacterium]|nr:AAA family ATPase [Clostridia bacterium]
MLNSLHIENIAVIENADIAFDSGFNVLTGETGAGKSIIIDSLNAVLGERITRDVIRTGCAGASVSAIFSDLSAPVVAALQAEGVEPDEDGMLLLERRLTADGKAAARINGRPVTVAMLRGVGRRLVNIHGQHENQALLNTDTHVDYLDRVGGLLPVREAYKEAYTAYREVKAQLDALDMDETLKARRMDLLRYQIDEIEAADLHEGEEEELRARREMFRNSEKIARSVVAAHQYLNGDEDSSGALSLLEQAANALAGAGRYMDEAGALAEKLQTLQYELDACADEVRRLEDMLDFDEAERDQVENRYELIRRLLSKYGATTGEVLAFLADCQAEYDAMESSDEEKSRLTVACDLTHRKAIDAAEKLTAARRAAAEAFCQAVGEQLTFLDMPRVQLAVSIQPAPLGANGADEVEFLLAANVGEPHRPLAKIASGGEMSRV